MFIKYVQKQIMRYVKEDSKLLGRWNYIKCHNNLDRKIMYANRDHCGPCGSITDELINKVNKKVR